MMVAAGVVAFLLIVGAVIGISARGSSDASGGRAASAAGTEATPGHLSDFVAESDLAHTDFSAQSEEVLQAVASNICEFHWAKAEDVASMPGPTPGDGMALNFGIGWTHSMYEPVSKAQGQEFLNAAVTTTCPDQSDRIQ